MFEIAGANGMRVKLDAAEVHDPGQTGCIVEKHLFGRPPRGEREGDGAQPVWPLLRRTHSDKTAGA
jgi:hypothetical protein